jgi:uncharacterized protein (UPF0332 family)
VNEQSRKLLNKAARSLRAAETLSGTGEIEFAVGRAYYAMFHTAQALLAERGLAFQRHGATHAAFGQHFVKTGILDRRFHQWLLSAYDERIQGDYGVDAVLTPERATAAIQHARELLAAVEALLAAPP